MRSIQAQSPLPRAPRHTDGTTHVGRLLRQYRSAAELTQEELAERAGLSARAISDLERGAKSRPHRATLDLLADALGLREDERKALLSARAPAGHIRTTRVELPKGGFLGAIPEAALVAREAELAQILMALDAAEGGEGRLILLTGEPGVGKTRLAQELMLRAGDRHFLAAAGSCYAPQQAVPYYPFLDVLDRLYRAAPTALRDQVHSQWPQLERLLPRPEARRAGSSLGPGSGDEGEWLARSVAGFLQALAETTPIAVLLDDLHWADGSTLRLLHHLARTTRSSRVLLLGTYRDVDVRQGHPLEGVLRDLDRDRLVRRLPVPRLNPAETGALIAAGLGEAEVSDEFTSLIYRYTEGNPFFTQEVVQALVERGDLFRSGERWQRRDIAEIDVPESVRSTIAERLSRLSDGTQEMLREASVLGQSFEFELLRTLENRAAKAIETAMEEAAGTGIVRVTGDDTYAFNHALTQLVLYAGLLPQRRRRLHCAAAEALERLLATTWRSQRSRRAAEVTWHCLEGDDRELALPYAILAGEQAEAVFARAEAEHHYRLALDLARQLRDAEREAQVRERLATLLTVTIRYPEALDMLAQAAALYRAAGDADSLARTIAQMGRVHLGAGTARAGAALLEAALREVSPGASSRALAGLSSALGRCLHVTGKYADALVAAERAIRMAGVEEPGVVAESSVTKGAVLAMMGRWSSALAVLEEAEAAAERAEDVFSACRGLQYVACVRLARGEFGVARHCMERARGLAERMKNHRQTATTIFGLSVIALLVGEADRSRHSAQQALRMVQSLGGFWLSVLQAAGLALAFAPREWSGASPEFRECVRIMEAATDLPELRAQQLLAAEDLDEGRTHAAMERLASLLEDPRLEAEQAVPARQLLARAYLEAGSADLAAGIVAEGLGQAERESLSPRQVGWMRVHALLVAGQGRRQDAASELDEALGRVRKMPYPFVEGEILSQRALLHQTTGGTE